MEPKENNNVHMIREVGLGIFDAENLTAENVDDQLDKKEKSKEDKE